MPSAFGTENPTPFKKDRSTTPGINLNRIESINPPIIANKAALEVVFFQKKPNINIANTPGLTNPVYSCMY